MSEPYWVPLGAAVPQSPGMSLIEEKIIVGTNQPLSFQNIPQTYRHLKLIGKARSNQAVAVASLCARFNNDAIATYYYQYISGTLAAAPTSASGNLTLGFLAYIAGTTMAANITGAFETTIPYYTELMEKSYHSSGGAYQGLLSVAGLWVTPQAINRIDLFGSATPHGLDAPTKVALYGIN